MDRLDKRVEDLILELQDMVNDAKGVPMSRDKKVIISGDRIFDILDEIEDNLPAEISVAKNIVAAGLADRCEIQLAYAIGVAKPVSVSVNTSGSSKISEGVIADKLVSLVDLRPAAIIDRFDLRRPIYRPLAAYGHMGREDINAPWEKTDIATLL